MSDPDAQQDPSDSTDGAPASSDSVEDRNNTADEHTLIEAVEAIIFAADEPVEPGHIGEIVSEVTGREEPSIEEVTAAVEHLNQEYRENSRALVVKEWGGGYRMATRSSLAPFVKTLFVGEQETSLSRSLLETLAVLAYRQPVTRPEVDFIRGVNSDYAIRKLMEMELADVKGRADSLGRPLLYGTTDHFLEQFGLENLDDLPTLREVEELLDDPAFDEERAKLLQLDAEEGVSVDPLEEVNGEKDSGESESTD